MKKLLLTSAVLAALSAPVVAFAATAATATAPVASTMPAADSSASMMEKCYGVVKAGANDCAAASHTCKGHAAKDGTGEDWINAPKGLCAKLVGGSLTKKS